MGKMIVLIISLLLIAIPILCVFIFIGFYNKIDNIIITQETLGQIGDYFGGLLNPLISYCGLVIIILTLWVSFMSLKNAIKDSTSIQERHIEELSQSNVINILQIFKETVGRIRSLKTENDDPKKALLRISANIQSPTEEEKEYILRYIRQIDDQWGISSRYISLLGQLNINANSFQKMIFDSAIAFLDKNELEGILFCLAAMNKSDLASSIADSNSERINENIKRTIQIISKISNNLG